MLNHIFVLYITNTYYYIGLHVLGKGCKCFMLALSFLIWYKNSLTYFPNRFCLNSICRNVQGGRQKTTSAGDRVHEGNWFSQECVKYAGLLDQVRPHYVNHGVCSTWGSPPVAKEQTTPGRSRYILNLKILSAYQEMVYCPVSNSSSQKPFVVHGTEGFEPRRADDACDYRKIFGVANK